MVICQFCFFSSAFNEFRASSFPFPFYFKTGDEIVLNCWLPDGYVFSNWTRPSGNNVSTTTGRFLVIALAHTVSLTVMNADASDAGEYSCNASKTAANSCHLLLHVYVCAHVVFIHLAGIGARSESSPVSAHYTEPLLIYSRSVNTTVHVGGAYNFSCNASHYLQLKWIFHDPNNSFPRVVSNTSDGRRIITQDNELHLTNIRFEDEGTYECRLHNTVQMLSLRNNLTVAGQENDLWYLDNSVGRIIE